MCTQELHTNIIILILSNILRHPLRKAIQSIDCIVGIPIVLVNIGYRGRPDNPIPV